jgi:hypothetical protein
MMFISVSHQEVTKSKARGWAGNNTGLVSLSKMRSAFPTPLPTSKLFRKPNSYVLAFCCLKLPPLPFFTPSPENYVNFKVTTTGTKEPDKPTKYYLSPWFLVHLTGAFSNQSPKTPPVPVPARNNITIHQGN